MWDGNLGEGTADYRAYGRKYRILADGKPQLACSADPVFRGDADRYDPEHLFVAALSGCHMLSYLALCAREGVRVTAYEDDARGTLALDARGGGKFTEVTLRPRVTIADPAHEDRARELHQAAHETCFIASSASTPVGVEPTIRIEAR